MKIGSQFYWRNAHFQAIKPLETLLEDLPSPLREDAPHNPMTIAEVLMNATKVVEEYFVVPLGNISLEESDKLDFTKIENHGQKTSDKMTLLMDSVKNKKSNCFSQTVIKFKLL